MIAADIPTLAPETPEGVAEALSEASRAGERVLPSGLGTRAYLGARPTRVDRVLSTRALGNVVAHDPADLTITVQAGLPLAELDALLAAHGQWLPHQAYRRRGSVGGLLASGADGALALRHGRARDDLVGARVALGDGTLARGRGRVVKNVAGYDLPRLLCGSLGTLGVLVEASFKLWPRPAAHASVVAGYDALGPALDAAARVARSPARPSCIDVLAGACPPQVAVGFDGHEARVHGECARLDGLLGGDGHEHSVTLLDERDRALRERLDDPPAALGADDGLPVLRWSGLPSRLRETLNLALALVPGLRLHLRPVLGLAWLAPVDSAGRGELPVLLEALRATGHAVLLAAPGSLRHDPDLVWGAPAADFELMRRVKRALDPGDTLAAGRFVGGL